MFVFLVRNVISSCSRTAHGFQSSGHGRVRLNFRASNKLKLLLSPFRSYGSNQLAGFLLKLGRVGLHNSPPLLPITVLSDAQSYIVNKIKIWQWPSKAHHRRWPIVFKMRLESCIITRAVLNPTDYTACAKGNNYPACLLHGNLMMLTFCHSSRSNSNDGPRITEPCTLTVFVVFETWVWKWTVDWKETDSGVPGL